MIHAAERETKCPACGEWIVPGDEILLDDETGDWLHLECADLQPIDENGEPC